MFSGYLNLYGNLNKPKFQGEFIAEEVYLTVPYLNVDFKAIGESNVYLSHNLIELNNFSFQSIDKGKFFWCWCFKWQIQTSLFSDFNMDLNLELDSILCLNTDAFTDNSYFGKSNFDR